jgi:ethanolamine ammonia-lyase small subunit
VAEIIRSRMQSSSNKKSAPSKNQMSNESVGSTVSSNQSISIADEIRKLGNLKKEGLITEDEFKQMKQDLLRKNNSV